MRIVIQSYYFPPMKAVGCVRNYNVAQELASNNEVLVLSTKNSKGLHSPNFDLSKLEVIYQTTFDLFFVKNSRKKKSSTGTLKPSFLPRLLNSFPFNISIWDGGFLYIICSLINIARFKPDMIYSSFSPYSDHFACYLYKLVNPKVVWVADFRDLHIDPEFNNVIFRNFQKRIDRSILKRANILTTVSDGLKHHLLYYNESVKIMRNGIGNHAKLDNSVKVTKKFNLVYTGMLYAGRRNPAILFQVIAELWAEKNIDLLDIEFIYAGSEGYDFIEIAKGYALNDFVKDLGMVSYTDSLNLQQEASINILLSWATKQQKGILTGKFYEYLIANRPIALVINGERDSEFEDIFHELKAGVVSYHNGNGFGQLKEFILDNYRSWKCNGYTTGNINTIALENYRWKNIIATIENING